MYSNDSGEWKLIRISTSEGFVSNDNGIYTYKYNYTDHLGNVRLTYKDNGSGNTEIEDVANYYPFGLMHKLDLPSNITLQSGLAYKFKYNGKELLDDKIDGIGLDMYNYGARPLKGQNYSIYNT